MDLMHKPKMPPTLRSWLSQPQTQCSSNIVKKKRNTTKSATKSNPRNQSSYAFKNTSTNITNDKNFGYFCSVTKKKRNQRLALNSEILEEKTQLKFVLKPIDNCEHQSALLEDIQNKSVNLGHKFHSIPKRGKKYASDFKINKKSVNSGREVLTIESGNSHHSGATTPDAMEGNFLGNCKENKYYSKSTCFLKKKPLLKRKLSEIIKHNGNPRKKHKALSTQTLRKDENCRSSLRLKSIRLAQNEESALQGTLNFDQQRETESYPLQVEPKDGNIIDTFPPSLFPKSCKQFFQDIKFSEEQCLGNDKINNFEQCYMQLISSESFQEVSNTSVDVSNCDTDMQLSPTCQIDVIEDLLNSNGESQASRSEPSFIPLVCSKSHHYVSPSAMTRQTSSQQVTDQSYYQSFTTLPFQTTCDEIFPLIDSAKDSSSANHVWFSDGQTHAVFSPLRKIEHATNNLNCQESNWNVNLKKQGTFDVDDDYQHQITPVKIGISSAYLMETHNDTGLVKIPEPACLPSLRFLEETLYNATKYLNFIDKTNCTQETNIIREVSHDNQGILLHCEGEKPLQKDHLQNFLPYHSKVSPLSIESIYTVQDNASSLSDDGTLCVLKDSEDVTKKQKNLSENIHATEDMLPQNINEILKIKTEQGLDSIYKDPFCEICDTFSASQNENLNLNTNLSVTKDHVTHNSDWEAALYNVVDFIVDSINKSKHEQLINFQEDLFGSKSPRVLELVCSKIMPKLNFIPSKTNNVKNESGEAPNAMLTDYLQTNSVIENVNQPLPSFAFAFASSIRCIYRLEDDNDNLQAGSCSAINAVDSPPMHMQDNEEYVITTIGVTTPPVCPVSPIPAAIEASIYLSPTVRHLDMAPFVHHFDTEKILAAADAEVEFYKQISQCLGIDKAISREYRERQRLGLLPPDPAWITKLQRSVCRKSSCAQTQGKSVEKSEQIFNKTSKPKRNKMENKMMKRQKLNKPKQPRLRRMSESLTIVESILCNVIASSVADGEDTSFVATLLPTNYSTFSLQVAKKGSVTPSVQLRNGKQRTRCQRFIRWLTQLPTSRALYGDSVLTCKVIDMLMSLPKCNLLYLLIKKVKKRMVCHKVNCKSVGVNIATDLASQNLTNFEEKQANTDVITMLYQLICTRDLLPAYQMSQKQGKNDSLLDDELRSTAENRMLNMLCSRRREAVLVNMHGLLQLACWKRDEVAVRSLLFSLLAIPVTSDLIIRNIDIIGTLLMIQESEEPLVADPARALCAQWSTALGLRRTALPLVILNVLLN